MIVKSNCEACNQEIYINNDIIECHCPKCNDISLYHMDSYAAQAVLNGDYLCVICHLAINGPTLSNNTKRKTTDAFGNKAYKS